MKGKGAALVCVLTAVGLAGVLGGLFRHAGGDVPGEHVIGKAVITHRITAGAAGEASGHSALPAPINAEVAPSEPDPGLLDADEVTLRATLEPAIADFAVQETTVSPDVESAEDPEEITRLATLEPALELPVD